MENELEKEESVDVLDKLKEETENVMCDILEDGIKMDNIDFLYKVIDVKKDIAEIEKEEQEMMYGNYDNYDNYGEYDRSYNGGRRRDSRGRYMEGNSYGRRGYDTKYRGHDMLDEMNYSYGAYSDNNEYGNYGETSTKELKKMLDCNIALIEHLKKNAKSQEEIEIIDRKVQEMSRL